MAPTGRRSGMFSRPDIATLSLAYLQKCLAVARAAGAVLGDELPQQILQGFQTNPVHLGTSILADREANRPLEWDGRDGVVLRQGKLHGIRTQSATPSFPAGSRERRARLRCAPGVGDVFCGEMPCVTRLGRMLFCTVSVCSCAGSPLPHSLSRAEILALYRSMVSAAITCSSSVADPRAVGEEVCVGMLSGEPPPADVQADPISQEPNRRSRADSRCRAVPGSKRLCGVLG